MTGRRVAFIEAKIMNVVFVLKSMGMMYQHCLLSSFSSEWITQTMNDNNNNNNSSSNNNNNNSLRCCRLTLYSFEGDGKTIRFCMISFLTTIKFYFCMISFFNKKLTLFSISINSCSV